MQKENVRNTNVEVLRFVLMAAILLWHVIVHGYDLKCMGCDGFVYGKNVPLSLFLAALTSPATYCFVFISGYFGMHLKARRFVEMLLWCVVVSVALTLARKLFLGVDLGVKDYIRAFFPITSERWWFMTAYVKLLVISPFINYGLEKLCRRSKLLLIAIFYCFSLFPMFLGGACAGSSLEGLIFVYLLGRYIREYGIGCFRRYKTIYLCSLAGLFALLLTTYYLLPMTGVPASVAQRAVVCLTGFSNPFIVVMAVCIFLYFINLPVWRNKTVNAMLYPSIFIYLITEFVGMRLYRDVIADNFDKNPALGGVIFISVLIGCLVIGSIIQFVVRKVVDMFAPKVGLLWK